MRLKYCFIFILVEIYLKSLVVILAEIESSANAWLCMKMLWFVNTHEIEIIQTLEIDVNRAEKMVCMH